jgi:hypothetical protein
VESRSATTISEIPYSQTVTQTVTETVPLPASTSVSSVPRRTTVVPTVQTPEPIPTRSGASAWGGVIAGTCDEGGSCGVKQRSSPYIDAPRLYPNDLKDGAAVAVVCQTNGDLRSSAGHGSSAMWYRLVNNAYINSVYVDLPDSGVPRC